MFFTNIKRNAYLLTTNENSTRTIFSKKILKKIGFNVIIITAIKHKNQVLSNKLSMQYIYQLIIENNEPWNYIFEDDINLVENISLLEIIEYEKISNKVVYLGLCGLTTKGAKNTKKKINNYFVYQVKRGRCLHAIALSKVGAQELLNFSKNIKEQYMDMILEKYINNNPANVIRMDLKSPIQPNHRGIFYQDRKQFKSEIL